ncbi:MAG: hypothetical protein U9N59_16005 [Campylobacterota bacterium]|nr:hypothetical protein [Campylobacterota bacterium]
MSYKNIGREYLKAKSQGIDTGAEVSHFLGFPIKVKTPEARMIENQTKMIDNFSSFSNNITNLNHNIKNMENISAQITSSIKQEGILNRQQIQFATDIINETLLENRLLNQEAIQNATFEIVSQMEIQANLTREKLQEVQDSIEKSLNSINNQLQQQNTQLSDINYKLSNSLEIEAIQRLNEAKNYLNINLISEAKKTLKKATKKYPYFESLFILANIYLQEDKKDKAYENFLKALAQAKNNKDKSLANLSLARISCDKKEYDNAHRYYSSAYDNNKSQIFAVMEQSILIYETDDSINKFNRIKKGLDSLPTNINYACWIGFALLLSQKYHLDSISALIQGINLDMKHKVKYNLSEFVDLCNKLYPQFTSTLFGMLLSNKDNNDVQKIKWLI